MTIAGTCVSRKQVSSGTTSVGITVTSGVVTSSVIGVKVNEEMRKCKEKGAKAKEENAAYNPARLVAISTKVADGYEAKHGSNVVSAGDEARLGACQVESLLNR